MPSGSYPTYPGSPSTVDHPQRDPQSVAREALITAGIKPTTANVTKLIALSEKHRINMNRKLPSNKSLQQAIKETMSRLTRDGRQRVVTKEDEAIEELLRVAGATGESNRAPRHLHDLQANEVSLVPKAANKRKFLILKSENDSIERGSDDMRTTYEKILKCADGLRSERSGNDMTRAQAVAHLLDADPSLYEDYLGDPALPVRKAHDDAESVPAQTYRLFQESFAKSGEQCFSSFVEKAFRTRPELGEAWLATSCDNAE